MNSSRPAGGSESPQFPFYGGYPQTLSGPEEQQHVAPPWIPPHANDGLMYGHRSDFPPPPTGPNFAGPRFSFPYGFDPSVPPPSFSLPPPGHFPRNAPPSSGHPYGSFPQQFGAPPPQNSFEAPSECAPRLAEDRRDGRGSYGGPSRRFQDEGYDRNAETVSDPETMERRRDQKWLTQFLQNRAATTSNQQPKQLPEPISIPAFREALYGAAELLSRLEELRDALQNNVEDGMEGSWSNTFPVALQVKQELEDKLIPLTDAQRLAQVKAKVSRLGQRRSRRLRAKKELQEEQKQAEARCCEKEALIDAWRMRRIQQVEERKKEQELKLAADSVLCEVRKKQADVKRMQDIMRSLEKLRRLRKEAASRKGLVTEAQSDEAFSSLLEQLRSVTKKRTELYSAEEKALMVMLEGEQEEERRREKERRAKKERERQMERRRRVDSMLFGDGFPGYGALEPFTEYYCQAERSLQALIGIRAEWDAFLVSADHPDGSSVPQCWVLPDPPSHPAWASALQAEDSDCDL